MDGPPQPLATRWRHCRLAPFFFFLWNTFQNKMLICAPLKDSDGWSWDWRVTTDVSLAISTSPIIAELHSFHMALLLWSSLSWKFLFFAIGVSAISSLGGFTMENILSLLNSSHRVCFLSRPGRRFTFRRWEVHCWGAYVVFVVLHLFHSFLKNHLFHSFMRVICFSFLCDGCYCLHRLFSLSKRGVLSCRLLFKKLNKQKRARKR